MEFADEPLANRFYHLIENFWIFDMTSLEDNFELIQPIYTHQVSYWQKQVKPGFTNYQPRGFCENIIDLQVMNYHISRYLFARMLTFLFGGLLVAQFEH